LSRLLLLSNALLAALLSILPVSSTPAADWTVPVAGNIYSIDPEKELRIGRRAGSGLSWSDAGDKYAVYIHVDRPATLELAFEARVPQGTSRLLVTSGDQKWPVTLTGAEFQKHAIGKLEVPQAGYFRIEIQGEERAGSVFAELRDVLVSSSTEGLKVDYVRDNEGNMFYWGRRGPSVHLSYVMPKEAKIQYGYSELTVPEGKDTMGSYFMANGFGEGYFGIQVNGPNERRVLFSIWSPFSTDNPKDIPEDQRIVKLASGEGVRVGEFGNEGSGGQSFLVYPWKAGTTYSFLTEVKPDSPESTVYTSWFCEKGKQDWKLMASFRRPKTQTSLKRFHSFLENFNPGYGHKTRGALYGNVWVRDVEGQWHECTQAKFSVDPTGGKRHRLDYNGGADGKNFFMTNCGFFSETGKVGEVFTRESTADHKPEINFEALPRK
jgi:hypothetical protein